MFTPQPQKSGWFLSPRTAERNGKGKVVALSEENGERPEEVQDAAVWKRFQEAGLLDQASLEKKDREALVQRISKVEAEVMAYF